MRATLLIAFFMIAPVVAAQEGPAGLQGDVLMSMEDARDKVLALVDAIPDDKLSWRPGEGVRSISEVMAHIAGGNYFFGTMLGAEMPEGVDPRGFEQSLTGKDELREAVNESFDHIASVIEDLSDESLEEQVQWFGGQERHRRFVLHFVSVHTHEHLGQLIAYARTNGVVPPWSM